MSMYPRFYSVIRAQWQHIGFSDVHKIRSDKANENSEAEKREKREQQAQYETARRELVDQE